LNGTIWMILRKLWFSNWYYCCIFVRN